MQFTDEIFLVKESREQNALKQFMSDRSIETHVWCDLQSVSSSEVSDAGQNGHKVDARALVHIEDYNREKIVRYPGGSPLISPGYYDVYRTYLVGDTIELYLTEKEGIR